MRIPELLINGRRFAWGPGVAITIGRDAACDVVVADPQVSRVHARIEAADQHEWRVVDADSSNGTWIDGRRISEALVSTTTTLTLGKRADSATVSLDFVDRMDAEPPPKGTADPRPPKGAPSLPPKGTPNPRPPTGLDREYVTSRIRLWAHNPKKVAVWVASRASTFRHAMWSPSDVTRPMTW